MTHEEAIALLAIDPGSDPQAIRRAYLRAVKRHKPERDPEGFRRVREAYELLTRPGGFFVSPAPLAHDEPPSPVADEPASAEAADIAHAETPSWEEDHFRRVDELCVQIQDAPLDERIAKLREALALEPENTEVRYLLLDELFAAERLREAADVAREGVALGDLGFKREIAASELTDTELEELKHEAPEVAFAELVNRDQLDDAVEVARAATDAFSAEPRPYIGHEIECVLALCAAGRVEEAQAIFGDLKKAVDASGVGSTLSDWNKTDLLLTEDLLAAWDELPPELAETILDAMREHTLENAEASVRAFAFHHPRDAPQAEKMLGKRAPGLYAVIGEWLIVRKPALAASPSGPSKIAMTLVAFVMIGVVRFACSQSHRAPSAPYVPPRLHLAPAPAFPETAGTEAQQSTTPTGIICVHHDASCPQALHLSLALLYNRCEDARGAEQALRARLESPPAWMEEHVRLEVDSAINELLHDYEQRCRESP